MCIRTIFIFICLSSTTLICAIDSDEVQVLQLDLEIPCLTLFNIIGETEVSVELISRSIKKKTARKLVRDLKAFKENFPDLWLPRQFRIRLYKHHILEAYALSSVKTIGLKINRKNSVSFFHELGHLIFDLEMERRFDQRDVIPTRKLVDIVSEYDRYVRARLAEVVFGKLEYLPPE